MKNFKTHEMSSYLVFFEGGRSAKVIAAAVPALEFATATRCGTAACALGCRGGISGCRSSWVHYWMLRESGKYYFYLRIFISIFAKFAFFQ